jgi:uncharacterized protein YndB with AHSA1/START domain
MMSLAHDGGGMPVTSGVFEVTVDAPIERVWPWVADLGRHAGFSPRDYAVEWTQGEPNAEGSRFRSVGWVPSDKHRVNEGEIVENRPMERFAFRAHDKDGSYANTFTLQPLGETTKVTLRLEFVKMNGMAALMAPMLFPLIAKPDNRKRMGLLKAAVETSSSPR